MSDETPKKVQFINAYGLVVDPSVVKPETIRDMPNMLIKDDDVLAVAYPKCGVTWTQYIIWEILHGGVPPPSIMDMAKKIFPFTEVVGIDAPKDNPSPRTIKFHSPYELVPKNPKAKYIVVFRNPFDCCVFYFHHLKQRYVISHSKVVTFDEFFDWFITGQIGFGDYFDFVLSWYPRRNDPNVLLLFYEQMKKDHDGTILKIADFLGDKYSQPIRSNPELLSRIKEYSSFSYMKEKLPLDNFLVVDYKGNQKAEKKIEFFRKGVVGDWKTLFSKEQEKKLIDKLQMKITEKDLRDKLLRSRFDNTLLRLLVNFYKRSLHTLVSMSSRSTFGFINNLDEQYTIPNSKCLLCLSNCLPRNGYTFRLYDQLNHF